MAESHDDVLPVQDPSMRKQVKVGDKVKFDADRINGQITVTKYKRPSERRRTVEPPAHQLDSQAWLAGARAMARSSHQGDRRRPALEIRPASVSQRPHPPPSPFCTVCLRKTADIGSCLYRSSEFRSWAFRQIRHKYGGISPKASQNDLQSPSKSVGSKMNTNSCPGRSAERKPFNVQSSGE
jgi:Copper binding periplasmic protein CusF